MSAGAFVRSVYTNNAGNFGFPIRVQPETLAASIDGEDNAPGLTTATAGLPTVNVSAGVRQNGVIPRKITIDLAEGQTAPPGYTGEPLQIVVLSKDVWDLATAGTTTSYLGVTWDNISRRDEIVN